MEPIAKLKELPPSSPKRPGRVQKLMGIIFQSDQKSVLGSWIIRPVEMLDRRLAGLGRSPDNPPLAMHVGIHVLIEDGREFVVEQLVGTPFEDFVDGLNWTRWKHFVPGIAEDGMLRFPRQHFVGLMMRLLREQSTS